MANKHQGDRHERGQTARAAPSLRVVTASLSGMAAAWLTAGSTGLLAHPLRHGLTWAALVMAVAAAWPSGQRTWKEHLAVIGGLVAAVLMSMPAAAVYNVLAVALVLAVLAQVNAGPDRRLLLVTALGASVLGVYVLASTAIPAVWLLADTLGRALGDVVAWISGKPLWVGATFGGLDFLVLMGAVYVGWLVSTPRPRLLRAGCGAAAILCGHFAYLALLACSVDLYEALPPPPPPPDFREYVPPPWSWSDAVRAMLPWNMPILAGLIQLSIGAAMFRWTEWLPTIDANAKKDGTEKATAKPVDAKQGDAKPAGAKRAVGKSRAKQRASAEPQPAQSPVDHSSRLRNATVWAPVILAALIPPLVTFAPRQPGQSCLDGKKIVACDRGVLDWDKPVHGRYGERSAGLYGMLPSFVESLGGRLARSAMLSEEDLADADVLVLIHPIGTWPEDQLQRIAAFVRRGGALLVLAETPVREGDLVSSCDEVLGYVLQPTGIEVRFDTALSVSGNWQHSTLAWAHPAVMGIGDERDRFWIDVGPSIRLRWPARPILVGRWGWSDPGVDAVLTTVSRFDAGEQLGDLVLAAEQRCGRGTVVVLSDASCFTNEGAVHCYPFTGRLLAYLAGRSGSPQAAWRQALGLLACAALLGLMARMARPAMPTDPIRVATVAVVLALSLAGSAFFSHVSTRVLPDGREHPAYNHVAYIDASHLEAYSDDRWSSDGIGGLALTLMRNGYLPFLLPELTRERLDRAGMLISIAPARAFSGAQREAVREFVEEGGIFVCMAGAEQCGPIQPLLNDFGLRVPRSPVRPRETDLEPKPKGAFSLRYLADKETESYGLVHFYTGWPIECPGAVYLAGEDDLPVICWKQVGRGHVVLVGDTAFAMNKNLEGVWRHPAYLGDHNAYFWRWLITRLTDQEDWIPPDVEAAQTDTAPDAAGVPPDGSAPALGLPGDKEAP